MPYKMADVNNTERSGMGLSFQQRKSVVLVGGVTAVVLVTLLLARSFKGNATVVTVEGKTIIFPAESLKLTTEQEDSLWKEHKLKPIKSRGATIFIDDEGSIRIPPAYIVEKMALRDLEELYHRYLGSIQTICKRKLHMGKIVDGGYDICQDETVAPKSPCLMYSFGVRDDFSFDEEVSSMYGCEVHSFDPANGMNDHKHSDKIYFHSLGIGGFDGVMNKNWKMRTFSSIKKELGHTDRKIEIVKIDVEAGEWPSFAAMLEDGVFKDIKQVITELHTWVDLPPAWTIYHRNERDYRQHLNVLRGMYEEGFRIFFMRRFDAKCCMFEDHMGVERTGCNEVHFMKVEK